MQKRSPDIATSGHRVNKPKPKTIHRKRLDDNFTVLPNALLQDKALSFRARGVLVMMLSMPDNWATHQTWIEEQASEGREAVRAAIKELETAGYLTRAQVRQGARLVGVTWNWFSSPLPESERTCFRKALNDGKPSAGFPSDGKPATTKYPVQEVPNAERRESKPQTVAGATGEVVETFDAKWHPKSGTKEEKLARIRPPRDAPTEAEFDAFLELSGLYSVQCDRPWLYHELCVNKWHQWKEHLLKWVRIQDWQSFVRGLESKISEPF